MKKIRILFTIPNFITAGSGREMFNIIDRLDKNIFELYIVVQKPGGVLYDEIISKGYKILVQPFTADTKSGLLKNIIAAKGIAKSFKNYKFDIWQSFNWSSDYSEALVARFAGARYFYVKKNMNWDRLAWKVKSLLANRIIARNTTLLQTHLSHRRYKNKTVLITGAVDTEKFKPITTTKFRIKYDIPADAKLVTCVAQLIRSKDQLTLIKAIASLHNVYLFLAGSENDEAYKQDIDQVIEELHFNNRVVLAGKVDNINELLNASDIFVLPTSTFGGHEEGCPVSLLEAMSAGVPAIASNVAGNRDLIGNEETGLLFEPGNVRQLTNCISKYIDTPTFAKKMSTAAMQKVYTYHTLEIEAKAFSTLYQTALQ